MDELHMKYFVLKPRGTDSYAVASRAAMREYARTIGAQNPSLARELEDWEIQERRRAAGFDDEPTP